MRKTITLRSSGLVSAALVLGMLPTLAGATVLTSDQFAYPNGNLLGNPGWQASSAAGAKPIQVSNGTILVQESAGSGEDLAKRWFVAQPANATTYSSFNLKVPVGSVLGTGVEYVAHFRPAPPDTNLFKARVFVFGPGTTTFNLGLSTTSVGSSPVVNWPSPLDLGVTYKVVTAYDAVTGTSTLWVNPSGPSSPSISSAFAGAAGSLIESYGFRQASPAGATFSAQVNDFVCATTFAEVAASKAPSLGQWGAMVVAMILMAGGALAILRRRTVEA